MKLLPTRSFVLAGAVLIACLIVVSNTFAADQSTLPKITQGVGSGLAILHTWPNTPVERTAHCVGLLRCSWRFSCGPPLTGSVSCHQKHTRGEDPTVEHGVGQGA
jgi:hypothetical protein